jgi:cell division protein FtsW
MQGAILMSSSTSQPNNQKFSWQKLRPWLPILNPTGSEWPGPAKMLWWLTFIWLAIGSIILFSASYYHGKVEKQDGLYYISRQAIYTVIGLTIFGWLVKTPLKKILKVTIWCLLACLAMVWATLLPGLGKSTLGASRWIGIGPIQIQPSELIKPFLVLHAARLFGQWRKYSLRTKSWGLGIFAMVLVGILLQPNLSTTALCGITLWLIACTAGISFRYLFGTAVGGMLVAILSMTFREYQRKRMMSFLNPWEDPQGSGFQLIQSLLAVGSGGLWGNGYGFSQQKLAYLPIQDTDFIFAVFAEEFGYAGSVVVIAMIIAYATISLNIAYRAKNMVHRLIAVGAMTFIVLQSLLNIGVATGALPTTGLPFPMFSYGGSSLIASLVMSALLIRVSRESIEEKVIPFDGAKGDKSTGAKGDKFTGAKGDKFTGAKGDKSTGAKGDKSTDSKTKPR